MDKFALGEIVDVFKCCLFTWGALTTILPAFIIAGAIATFISSGSVIKYLGAKAKKYVSYGIASVSGKALTICSCTIVPLFASIYRRGAGLGPAITFLYASPAMNFVSLVLVFKVIGPVLGILRVLGAIIIGVVIGLVMAWLFRKERQEQVELVELEYAVGSVKAGVLWVLFLGLFGVLVIGSTVGGKSELHSVDLYLAYKLMGMGVLLVLVSVVSWRYFPVEDLKAWGVETFRLIKLIVPIFIPCILVIAILAKYTPLHLVQNLLGAQRDASANPIFIQTLRSSFIAAVFGSLMYFPILTEVIFTKAFLKLGMDVGPAVALLLTGPGLSLPGLVLIHRFIGLKKTIIYWLLLVVLATLFSTLVVQSGYIYECACRWAENL